MLLTDDDKKTMLYNGKKHRFSGTTSGTRTNVFPVAKLFTPDADCIWLLTELDPDDPDIAWGLCDMGMGHPELARTRLSEIKMIRGPLGRHVERDPHFTAEKTLGQYAEEALISGQALGRILP